jgi:hypothetical protein
MSISGVVIVMTADAELERLMPTLKSDRRITLGPCTNNRQAAVIDTPSPVEDEDVHRWIESLPGIAAVEVACVYLVDEPVDALFDVPTLSTFAQELK